MPRPTRLPYAVADLVNEIKAAGAQAKNADYEPFIAIAVDAVSFDAARGEASNHMSGKIEEIQVHGCRAFKFAGVLFVLDGS